MEWRGEGITEVLVAIVIAGWVVVFFAPLFALVYSVATEQREATGFVRAFFAIVVAIAALAAGVSAHVSYRAQWRRGVMPEGRPCVVRPSPRPGWPGSRCGGWSSTSEPPRCSGPISTQPTALAHQTSAPRAPVSRNT
jgi:hypothetical protein